MIMKYLALFVFSVLLILPHAEAAQRGELQVSVSKPDTRVSIDQVVADDKIVASVNDKDDKPLLGLNKSDFAIHQDGRQAKVTNVQAFSEEFDVPLHYVLVFDNSDSMQKRNAVEPLQAAADELLKNVRPIDNVSIIVFDKKGTTNIGGHQRHVKILHSSDQVEMREFLAESYSGKQITYQTWLHEAMLAGYDLLGKLPADQPKFMVVFSDGEDNASTVDLPAIVTAGKKLPKFGAYAIDFMPSPELMPALQAFTEVGQGRVWKAADNASLLPIFREVATDFNRYYVVEYIFPVTGSMSVEPEKITIEEVKTFDASPMLGHIYFDENASTIPERYSRRNASQVAEFNEQAYKDTMEKYYQVLDIIGKRMVDNPGATLTLVGCNANIGPERGNKELSMARAVAVRDYLVYVWGITPERLAVEARNLPAMPSTSRLEEGQADNRRVEIQATDAPILDLVRSTYIDYRTDGTLVTLNPQVDSAYGFTSWHANTSNSEETIAERHGERAPPEQVVMSLASQDLASLATGGDLKSTMKLVDGKGQELTLTAPPVHINYVQTSQLLAKQQGYKVQEKYALILFDFDSDAIGDRNQAIVAEIVHRIRELPEATVTIVGHTDNIGKPDYNQKLSERRAKAVYDQIVDIYGTEDTDRISYLGIGANLPLYENLSSEARAFNRTVTIVLDYTARQ